MTALPLATASETSQPPRLPRLLVAGEFSTGKSHLINALLGQPLLPSAVTATPLPPVWLRASGLPARRIDSQGAVHALPAAGLSQLPQDTAWCLCPSDAPILRRIELIDTPGTSDPSRAHDSWAPLLDHADGIVWCTNAVQAWRQSEKAFWADMPARLKPGALLIVTHADRLASDEDRQKLLRRLHREAGETFDGIVLADLNSPADLGRIRDYLLRFVAEMADLSGSCPAALTAPVAAPVAASPAPQRAKPTAPPLENVFRGRAQRIWQEMLTATPGPEAPPLPAALQAQLDRYFARIDTAFQRIYALPRPTEDAAAPAPRTRSAP